MNYYFCKGVIINDCIGDGERIDLVKYFISSVQFCDESVESDFYPFSSFMRNVTVFMKENSIYSREMVKTDSFLRVIRGQ